MARVLSALALLPLVIGIIWFLPWWATLVLAEVVLLLAFREYAALATAYGASLSRGVTVVGVAATAVAVAFDVTLVVLMAAGLTIGIVSLATGRRGSQMLLDVASSLFPLLYLGLPIGALVAVQEFAGREAVVLLLATIMVSDTAQYYGGRWLGRTPLAPAISPKKTVEGALFGLAAGVALMLVIATPGLDRSTVPQRALLGVALVGLGIAGDLFESQLKRGAGVKDASVLIPGHGGMLDRIDSLLFAAPGFYLFLKLA
ncbi:MAG: phosphatidate cytidylyltransferase [Vicinamibacterales bacterium]|jgi:phosphatidate cytidylyltransferase|nr:phosphatidate cytidylyltransferase [Vicinamibacterales bacterium]